MSIVSKEEREKSAGFSKMALNIEKSIMAAPKTEITTPIHITFSKNGHRNLKQLAKDSKHQLLGSKRLTKDEGRRIARNLQRVQKLKKECHSVEDRTTPAKENPLAEITFYNPKEGRKPAIEKSPEKSSKENSNIFCFTFNREKFQTPSPGGTGKKRQEAYQSDISATHGP